MIRWALKLSEFNVEWEHRPGVQNVVADLLSRNPVDSVEGSQISCAALRALAINSREQFIKEQREDPELGHIYRYLENPDDGSVNATVCESWSQDFKLINGLLFYAKYFSNLGELRVYIPGSLRKDIMKEFPDLPLTGHLGKRKTYLKLRRVYRPRQSDTISSDSPVATLFDEQEVSHGLNRSIQGQFKEHRKTSSQESEGCRSRQGVESIADPSRLPDRRTATTTGESRMEVSGRDNQTRQTRATTRGRNKQAEKPVRSNQANTRRPCPYYLRSRIQERDGIPEELSNIEINGIPHGTLRRRSLSMEALDGDPVHRI
ncbi:uncharacterized protein TNCV_1917541 [Trichonephila clavipes]|uniref:Integrase zinc-binding domain-containing protein n=1 Tax=Trichonephila clavipes TaxID=2585209 RepID=A0A8X6W0T0_TRICX|nr:uncharacterized protein TNCV_1917541 [Trichonephila clavipes]